MIYCLRKDVYANANYSVIFRQRVRENKSKSRRILRKKFRNPTPLKIPEYHVTNWELRLGSFLAVAAIVAVFSIFLCICSYFFKL